MAGKSIKPRPVRDNDLDSEELEEVVNESVDNMALAEEYEEENKEYEMLCGYKDGDGVTHSTFTLREMTGRDQEAVSKPDIKNNPAKLISILLARCVTSMGALSPKSMGRDSWDKMIKQLYTGDQDYMFLMLRKVSLGEEIEAIHICPNPECKVEIKSFIGVDELEVVPFKGESIVSFELPRGYKDKKGVVHKKGTMRLPIGLDREILMPLAKTNLAKAQTTMLTRLCKFDDNVYIDDEVMSGLVIRDRDYLTDILQENYFGVNFDTEIMCSACGETFKAELNAINFI